MSEPRGGSPETMRERLARKWRDENTAAGPDGAYSFIAPEQAAEEARWWLEAIADEMESLGATHIIDTPCEIHAGTYMAHWLRTEAKRP